MFDTRSWSKTISSVDLESWNNMDFKTAKLLKYFSTKDLRLCSISFCSDLQQNYFFFNH